MGKTEKDVIGRALIDRAYACHCSSMEEWQEGNPVKHWYDENGNLCIKYESGKWWHYREIGQEFMWW